MLSVTANNASRAFDAANPAFTYAITGFVGSDTAATAVTGAPVLASNAVPKSTAGSYIIMTGTGSLAATNYTFNLVNGTLTITGNSAQAILFPNLANFTHGTSVPLVAIASSGLTVTFTASGPATRSADKP